MSLAGVTREVWLTGCPYQGLPGRSYQEVPTLPLPGYTPPLPGYTPPTTPGYPPPLHHPTHVHGYPAVHVQQRPCQC